MSNASTIGDGLCHDENNIEECFYDFGDCCHRIIDDSECTECFCKQFGVKFPVSEPQNDMDDLYKTKFAKMRPDDYPEIYSNPILSKYSLILDISTHKGVLLSS